MSAQKSILTYFKRDIVKRSSLVPLNSPSKKFKSDLSGSDSDPGKKDIIENDKTISIATPECSEITTPECSNKNVEESNKSGSGVLTGDDNVIAPEPRRWEKNNIDTKRLKAKLKLLSNTCSILDPNLPIDWFAALEKPLSHPSFLKLNEYVNKKRKIATVYPPADKVWTWTKFCRLDELKVVILGQDPYHNYGQAHGLCFSVPVGVRQPPSLANIFKELSKNYEDFEMPYHGHLMGWAMQGVLLLNIVLTVEEGRPNSHKNQGWENVTLGFIKYINENLNGLVFLLWGNNAQKAVEFIDKKKHHVLTAGHPSPLSVRLFFGCRHFKKCNDILKEQNKVMIHWDWLPNEELKPGVNEEFDEIRTRKKFKFDKFQTDMLKPFLDVKKYKDLIAEYDQVFE